MSVRVLTDSSISVDTIGESPHSNRGCTFDARIRGSAFLQFDLGSIDALRCNRPVRSMMSFEPNNGQLSMYKLPSQNLCRFASVFSEAKPTSQTSSGSSASMSETTPSAAAPITVYSSLAFHEVMTSDEDDDEVPTQPQIKRSSVTQQQRVRAAMALGLDPGDTSDGNKGDSTDYDSDDARALDQDDRVNRPIRRKRKRAGRFSVRRRVRRRTPSPSSGSEEDLYAHAKIRIGDNFQCPIPDLLSEQERSVVGSSCASFGRFPQHMRSSQPFEFSNLAVGFSPTHHDAHFPADHWIVFDLHI